VTFNAIWGDDLPEPPEPWTPRFVVCTILLVALVTTLVYLLNTCCE
jgi:hypothetical protein